MTNRYAKELIKVIHAKPFDKEHAKQLIAQLPDVNRVYIDAYGCPTLLLGDAVEYSNAAAVRFLLEHGADPNIIARDAESMCPIWLIIFPGEPDETEERIKIAKLLLEYGGNPNLAVEGERIIDELEYELHERAAGYGKEYQQEVWRLMKDNEHGV